MRNHNDGRILLSAEGRSNVMTLLPLSVSEMRWARPRAGPPVVCRARAIATAVVRRPRFQSGNGASGERFQGNPATTLPFRATPAAAPNVPCGNSQGVVPSSIHPLCRSSVWSSNDLATLRVRAAVAWSWSIDYARVTMTHCSAAQTISSKARPSMGALQVELPRDLRQLPPDDRHLNHPPRREQFAA